MSAVVDVPHEAFAKIIAPFKDKAGIRLFDTQRNEDHNRLVVTVIGSEEALMAMTINGAAPSIGPIPSAASTPASRPISSFWNSRLTPSSLTASASARSKK